MFDLPPGFRSNGNIEKGTLDIIQSNYITKFEKRRRYQNIIKILPPPTFLPIHLLFSKKIEDVNHVSFQFREPLILVVGNVDWLKKILVQKT
jgi:hypothetical protein